MGRLLPLLLLLAGCAAPPLQPQPAKLHAWTTTLRDRQPEDAFATVHKVGDKHLVFIAAKHANRDDSLTFRLIREAFAAYAFDVVIAEGFATSRGPNPPRIFQYARESGPNAEGFVEGGELVPAALGAEQEGATLWGGEPDDAVVKARLLAQRFSEADLLGFYVLRSIPQWIGERKIDHAADPRLEALVTTALARNRELLQLPPAVLPDHARWAAWYQALNRKPIGADFVTEEVGPLADGRFGTNRIAYAISLARDAYLHELIVTHLKARKSVLVVFGASHLMIHEPALRAVLGRACYKGADLAQSLRACH
jgi:hypothetical protein